MKAISRRIIVQVIAPARQGINSLSHDSSQVQQMRGIRVQVRNGNLEQALAVMQRVMQSSGIERLIKQEQTRHIKNSEKRTLGRKNLERKIRSQDHCRKLQMILVKKVSRTSSMFESAVLLVLHFFSPLMKMYASLMQGSVRRVFFAVILQKETLVFFLKSKDS
ncbi:hypothetical protein V6N12_022346 [Hibiscus sabdariffa]|uniref:Ribosomal protein S21 n=1 Tax=Hibiscus sabdariffa TaxID=183260 RepID=A0ABR2FV06_9ROSI